MKKLLLATAAVAMMGSVAAAKPVEVHNAAAATIVVKIHDENNIVVRSWELPTGQTFKFDIPEYEHATKMVNGEEVKLNGPEGWRVSASNTYGAFTIDIISKPITQEYGRDFHIVGGWNEDIHWKFSSV